MAYDKQTWEAQIDNGKIPPSLLAQVVPYQYDRDLGGPALMHPEAALAMGAMLRQAAEDGYPDLGIALSYRTYAKQLEKWAAYQAGTGNLAARPGTSNHGWAVAADLNWGRTATIEWAHKNAHRWGFHFDVPTENWHIVYYEHEWDGSEMTDEERKLLTWLEGFKKASTENLPGNDTGPAMGRALAEGAKHAASKGHVTKKHTHSEGVTGSAKDTPAGHLHRDGTTGPAREP